MNTFLNIGDSGAEVLLLQKHLIRHGASLSADGHFGNATLNALLKFQRQHNLVADGIAGPKTLNALRGYDTGKLLGQADIEQAAVELGVDTAAVNAVVQVESRGQGFLNNGLPVILFERHIMARRLRHRGEKSARIDALQQRYPNLVNRSPGGYYGYESEHYRLDLAKKLNEVCALESASWGLFQIMGFHWRALGYESVQDYVSSMHRSEADQLQAFVRLIRNDNKLHSALKQQHWSNFARGYNGSGYKKNRYHTRLADAYEQFKTLETVA